MKKQSIRGLLMSAITSMMQPELPSMGSGFSNMKSPNGGYHYTPSRKRKSKLSRRTKAKRR